MASMDEIPNIINSITPSDDIEDVEAVEYPQDITPTDIKPTDIKPTDMVDVKEDVEISEDEVSDTESILVDEEGNIIDTSEDVLGIPTIKTISDEINGVDDSDLSDEYDDDEYDDEDYLKKFSESVKTNVIEEYHKELKHINYDEITALTKIIRDKNGNVIDPIHKTIPFLTKFERARVLGIRAKQINSGAQTFIEIPDDIIEGHVIAEMELEKKALPFIIARPLPNGKKEYWNIKDLELIDY